MIAVMASAAICTLSSPFCTPASTSLATCNLPPSVIPQHKTLNFHISLLSAQSVLSPFSPWDGLRHLGILARRRSLQSERKGTCKGKVVYASLFGVGAPEALVIGVVALLVFGPKGLAEVARNLGKTLREFQPTIRELQDVSREFKSTLEREIGLDDVQNPSPSPYTTTSAPPASSGIQESKTVADPNGVASPSGGYTSEEFLKATQEQLSAAAARREMEAVSPSDKQSNPQPEDGVASSSNRANSSEEVNLGVAEKQPTAAGAVLETNPASSPTGKQFKSESKAGAGDDAAPAEMHQHLKSDASNPGG